LSRIGLVPPEDAQEGAAQVFRTVEQRGGALPTLYQAIAQSPPVLEGWFALGEAIRSQTTLDPRLREFAILRVAHQTGSDYIRQGHLRAATRAGATDAQLASIIDWPADGVLTSREEAVLAYADALAAGVSIDDATFAEAARLLTERELLELTVTAAFYVAVARVIDALEL
jgi:AhpD family alkylhydroperoxidase